MAKEVEKTLRSAIANAERKADDAGESLDVDQLYVTTCYVNEGPRWKRMRTAPMGRGFRYQKRTSHIVMEVSEHHHATAERARAAAAEAEASKERAWPPYARPARPSKNFAIKSQKKK